MAVTSAFHEAVSNGDLRRVRIMMKDSLLLDPTFKTFKDMEAAAKSLADLYEPHDGREFKLDKSEWTDDYINDLQVQAISNFSHERLQHLQDVVRYLHPAPEPVRRPASTSSQSEYHEPRYKVTYEEQKRRDQERGAYIGSKVATGAVVGAVTGAAGAAIAVAASAAAVGIVGASVAGAFVGGTAAYVAARKER